MLVETRSIVGMASARMCYRNFFQELGNRSSSFWVCAEERRRNRERESLRVKVSVCRREQKREEGRKRESLRFSSLKEWVSDNSQVICFRQRFHSLYRREKERERVWDFRQRFHSVWRREKERERESETIPKWSVLGSSFTCETRNPSGLPHTLLVFVGPFLAWMQLCLNRVCVAWIVIIYLRRVCCMDCNYVYELCVLFMTCVL